MLFSDSELDHPRLAKLVAAHARPPNYMFFFEFYESRNLAEKLHVEEWSPSIEQVVRIACDLGVFSLLLTMYQLFSLALLHLHHIALLVDYVADDMFAQIRIMFYVLLSVLHGLPIQLSIPHFSLFVTPK